MAFAVSTVIAAVGVGVAGYGLYNQTQAQKAGAAANEAAAANQAEISRLQAGNVDNQQAQLNLQQQQQQLQISTQRQIIEQQAEADTLRQQASVLDATRRRRDAIREGIVARANSLVAATNQGAGAPGSSAVAQSDATISGQTGVNLLGISQNLELGRKLYDINKNITAISLNAQTQNSGFVNQSRDLQSQALETQRAIYNLGSSVSLNYAAAASASSNAATGAALFQTGTAIANNYPTINRITGYFGGSTGTTGNNYGYTASTYGNGYT